MQKKAFVDDWFTVEVIDQDQSDIESTIVDKIVAGFSQIERSGKLQQGNGLFDFGDFQIHI